MIGPNITKWLCFKVKLDLRKAKKVLKEIHRLHDEYSKRNRGEDGWKPGIWYQEEELAKEIPVQEAQVAFLKSVIKELK